MSSDNALEPYEYSNSAKSLVRPFPRRKNGCPVYSAFFVINHKFCRLKLTLFAFHHQAYGTSASLFRSSSPNHTIPITYQQCYIICRCSCYDLGVILVRPCCLRLVYLSRFILFIISILERRNIFGYVQTKIIERRFGNKYL
jgi:hypothetical protein